MFAGFTKFDCATRIESINIRHSRMNNRFFCRFHDNGCLQYS